MLWFASHRGGSYEGHNVIAGPAIARSRIVGLWEDLAIIIIIVVIVVIIVVIIIIIVIISSGMKDTMLSSTGRSMMVGHWWEDLAQICIATFH